MCIRDSFGAAVAYTVDGGELGELEYENFNAANAGVYFHGVNIHPGSAKNKMKNAILIALELSLIHISRRHHHPGGLQSG